MNKRIRPTEFTITTNSAKLKEVSMAGKGKFNVKDKLVSTDKVRMDIAGIGNIHYKGSPSVQVDKAGIGNVKKMN